ncbi:Hypothetical predicted protein [Paramuricea clavata]|nr:Hypothetical predicted protein [Paramuricea clavata]
MGAESSKSGECHHNEVPFVPVEDVAIGDGDIRRLWSYNSTSGGKYVYMTNDTVTAPGGSQAYVVAATGEAEGTTMPLTDIRFDQTQPIPLMFELKFKKDNAWYAVHASHTDVTASQMTDGTSFEVMALRSPNQPFVVLRSNKKLGKDDLFLSSDGAGKMKLKVSNQRIRRRAPEVDPALLFRVVRP